MHTVNTVYTSVLLLIFSNVIPASPGMLPCPMCCYIPLPQWIFRHINTFLKMLTSIENNELPGRRFTGRRLSRGACHPGHLLGRRFTGRRLSRGACHPGHHRCSPCPGYPLHSEARGRPYPLARPGHCAHHKAQTKRRAISPSFSVGTSNKKLYVANNLHASGQVLSYSSSNRGELIHIGRGK
jgi:hypothetical protein